MSSSHKAFSTTKFLLDVVYLSFTAFGGPAAHIAMMLDFLVEKRKYLTAEELIELNALCQLLPGPTSTQTIISTGYKLGGVKIAFLTLMIWVFPAVVLMSTLSFALTAFSGNEYLLKAMTILKPMAVGFVLMAAYKLGRKVVTGKLTMVLLCVSAVLAVVLSSPWVFPVILIMCGFITSWSKRKTFEEQKRIPISPPWKFLIVFLAFFIIPAVLALFTQNEVMILFENFYRFGSLIFGGGQVLIPFMYEHFVDYTNRMTSEEFLTGYGIVQALPGPVFSFCAFAGGISFKDSGTLMQMAGCLIGATGIFLPGTLLIFFVYPIWESIKQIPAIKHALLGINAAAGGLMVAAVFMLGGAVGFSWLNLIVVLAVALTMIFTKLPSPVVVLIGVILGLMI